MAYPWPGFDTFLFTRDEAPITGSDTGWNQAPSYARSRPLGGTSDSIVTLAIGSAERTLEVFLSPDRFAALAALVNTSATFTDWERPTPDSRSAFLTSLQQQEFVAVRCSDGSTQKRIRTAINLVSQ